MFRPLSALWTIFSPSLPLFLDLDINLSPSGTIVKKARETLDLTLQIDASEDSKVSWTKVKAIFLNNKAEINNDKWVLVVLSADILFQLNQDNVKLDKEPKFTKVIFSESGRYECEVTMGLLSRKASFELVVEGKAQKRKLRNVWKYLLCSWELGERFSS